MAFFKKGKHEPRYLTAADRERLAAVSSNPAAEHRKCKFGLTLGHPDITSQVYIIVYGKDADEVKEHIAEYLKFFKSKDSKWKIISTEDLKEQAYDDSSDV